MEQHISFIVPFVVVRPLNPIIWIDSLEDMFKTASLVWSHCYVPMEYSFFRAVIKSCGKNRKFCFDVLASSKFWRLKNPASNRNPWSRQMENEKKFSSFSNYSLSSFRRDTIFSIGDWSFSVQKIFPCFDKHRKQTLKKFWELCQSFHFFALMHFYELQISLYMVLRAAHRNLFIFLL